MDGARDIAKAHREMKQKITQHINFIPTLHAVLPFEGGTIFTLNRQYPNVVNEDESVIQSANVVRQQIHYIAGRSLCRGSLRHSQCLTINSC